MKNTMYVSFLVCATLLLILSAPSLAWNIDNWQAGDTCYNMSFLSGNQTLNLSGYLDSNITNVSINFTGYPGISDIIQNADYRLDLGYNGEFVEPTSVINPADWDDGDIDSYATLPTGADTYFWGNYTGSGASSVTDANISYSVNVSTVQANSGVVIYCLYVANSTWSPYFYYDNGVGQGWNNFTAEILEDCLGNESIYIQYLFIDRSGGAPPIQIFDTYVITDQQVGGTGDFPVDLEIVLNGSTSEYTNSSSFNDTDYLVVNTTYLNEYFSEAESLEFMFSTSNNEGYLYACLENYTFFNWINFTFYDLATLGVITNNISVEVSNNVTTSYYWSNWGNLTIFDDWAGTYLFEFTSQDYQESQYYITFSDNESLEYDVYISNASNEVIFTFKDSITDLLLEGVTVTQDLAFNGTWLTVSTQLSDITGRIQFNYIENERYRFTASYSGYDTKQWVLDPVIFASYTVRMIRSDVQPAEEDYEDITLSIIPTIYYEGIINNVTITLQHLSLNFTDYYILMEYPGGSNLTTGSNPGGETAYYEFNITGAGTFDTVNLTISYNTTYAQNRTFTRFYEIIGDTPRNYTWMANLNNAYDLGLFERILIATLLTLVLAGLAGIVDPLAGGVVGLLSLGLFSYIGFIPLWGILPSMLVGIFLLIKRGGS